MLDFFYDPDWLNRPGPYAFKLDHILFIVIITILGIALAILLRRCQRKTVHIVLVTIWAFLVAIEILKWIVIYTRVLIDESYPFDIETMLPLHSCSLFMYVCPFALFSKNKIIKKASSSFLVSISMIMGYITMFVGFGGKNSSVFSFFGLHTLVFHAILFIVPLIMLVTKYYEIEKKDILYGLGLFAVFTMIIFVFDCITKCDYMYIYDGHTFGVFKFIYENVHHLIWTIISVSAYCLTAIATHFIAYFSKQLLTKNK